MSALEKDAWKITFSEVKAAAEDIIEEARKGRMFILVDDEDRENEGDLVIPAQWATPETINFMAKHARGLICLALTRERVEQLGLALMAQNNGTRHQTAFTDSIVRRLSENAFDSTYGGEFRCVIYVNKVTMAQHLALVKGDPAHGGPVMVRMHAGNIFTDLLGQRDTGRGGEIEVCMREIAKEGRGVLVLIREAPTVMLSEQRRRSGERIQPAGGELRDYGVGAQILIDLGVKEMVLLTNTSKSIVGLEGFGLKVVAQKPIPRDAES